MACYSTEPLGALIEGLEQRREESLRLWQVKMSGIPQAVAFGMTIYSATLSFRAE